MRKILIFLAIIMSSCSTLKSKEYLTVSFENIKKVSFDSESLESIKLKFGPPDKEVSAPQQGIVALIYNQKNSSDQLMSIVFDINTKILKNLNWSVNEGDPAQKLESCMKLFPNAHFIFKDSEWQTHYKPAEGYYFDDSKGISISYNTARKEVSSINFYKAKALETLESRKLSKE